MEVELKYIDRAVSRLVRPELEVSYIYLKDLLRRLM